MQIVLPHPAPPTPAARICGLLSSGIAVAVITVTASAATPDMAAAIEFDQPSQPLLAALSQLGQRAGLSVLAPQALLAGRQAPALRGRHAPQAALNLLLAGSGLQAAIDGRVISVHPAADPSPPSAAASAVSAPAQQLPAVVVRAAAMTEPTSASSVRTLGRDDLERIPATSPADLLREVSGVTVANARNGASLDINIRGMQGFGRVKLMVDGTESSSSEYKGYGGDTTHAYVDPELLGELKVEKGPNSGPYGAGVVGGVVSLSTLSASDLIAPGQTQGLRLRGTLVNNQAEHRSPYLVLGPGPDGSASVGTVERALSLPGHAWNGSLAGAWRVLDERLELVAGLSQRQAANYVAGSRGDVFTRSSVAPYPLTRVSLYEPGGEVFNSSQDTDSLLLKAALTLPQAQRLSVGYSRLKSRFGEARSAGFIEYIEQLNLSSVDKTLYTAQYAWSPKDRAWLDLRVNLWAAHSDGYQAADLRGVASVGQVHRAQWQHVRGRGMEAWNTSVLDLTPAVLTLKYGLTWLGETTDVRPLDGGIYLDPAGERSLKSAFVQAEFEPTPWLMLQAGLRREHYRVQGETQTGSGIAGQILPLILRDGHSRSNPSLGVTVQPWQSLQLFARGSEGWRPPTVKETLNGLVAASNTARRLLQPEIVRSKEGGARLDLRDLWQAGDRLDASLSAFDNLTLNYMHGFAGEFTNADSARMRGVELNLGYDAGTAFLRYGLTRYQRVSFCGVQLAFDEVPPCFTLPRVFSWDPTMSGLYVPPRAQRSLNAGLRLRGRSLTLGLRMTAADDFALDGYAVGGWRSHEIYDLYGSWQLHARLSVSLSVENLRDRFYMEASTSGMLAIPSPGRTTKLTLSSQF